MTTVYAFHEDVRKVLISLVEKHPMQMRRVEVFISHIAANIFFFFFFFFFCFFLFCFCNFVYGMRVLLLIIHGSFEFYPYVCRIPLTSSKFITFTCPCYVYNVK